MRILITGIGGFLGSHLAKHLLLREECEVFGTMLAGESVKNLEGIEKNISLIECNVCSQEQVENAVLKSKPDIVFHFAAQANVYLSWSIPEKTMRVNLLGSLNLLEALRKHSPNSIVLLSSTREVYGAVKKSALPITEKQPLNPLNPYAVSKVAMELLGKNYFEQYGLKTIIVRSFNITGPGRPPEFACSDWARQLAMIELGLKEPFIETGVVSAVRDFTDVRDAVEGFWLAVKKCKYAEPYNLCSGKGYKMSEVLNLISGFSKKEVKKITKKEKIVRIEVPYAVGSNAKLRKATGWKPKIKLEKTLCDLVDYWKKELSKKP
ncbi:MAG: GDP-mannose 4,6-dehydratase [Candidatus Diapherotrites archaeon]